MVQHQRATQMTKVVVNIGTKKKTRARRRRAPAPRAFVHPPSAPMPIREVYFMSELGRAQPVQGSLPQASKELSAPKVQQPESDPFVAQGAMSGTPNQLTPPPLRAGTDLRERLANLMQKEEFTPRYEASPKGGSREFEHDVRRLPPFDRTDSGGFRCPICPNTLYTSQGWLTRHMKMKHGQ
jgi:hypothetical protein